MWDSAYVPFCRHHGYDPYSYDTVAATNFLNMMQDKYEAQHVAAGKPPNHGMFKQARAGVATMFAMFHPEKPPLAEWVHIKNIAQDLRATAPNLPKYSETISLDPFFATLIAAWKQGLRFEQVSLKILRNWCLVLVRIRSTAVEAPLPSLLFSQGVRRFVNSAITTHKSCWDKLMPLPPLEVLENLRRFAGPDLRLYNGRPIRPLPADLLTDTDASGFGGGIVSTSPLELEGRWHWLSAEAKKHINWKELVTHLRGLESLEMQCPGLVLNSTIFNRTDNSVSMSYVNRQGGRVPELSFAAEALWYWLLARGCTIRDLFLPGVQNVRADTASRWWIDASEYQLLPALFRKVDLLYGPFTVDAFATRVNHQLKPF